MSAAEAERQLVTWKDSRETAWILLMCLAFACLAQSPLHELLPMLLHFINAQIPTMAEMLHYALSPIKVARQQSSGILFTAARGVSSVVAYPDALRC
jgi:hypothetical protein